MKIKSVNKLVSEPTFTDIKEWYDSHLAPNVNSYDDDEVYKNVYHDEKWCGIFQCTSQGAQRLFQRAKPKCIVDIAALTSIYRPGPLAANVDKLWLKHESEPYNWGHPLINETLKETRGLLIFQEAVMSLANKVGGFPMEKCDEIRRAIMKRSISGGDAAKKAALDLEESFVNGAVANGVPIEIAKKAYQTILFMSGYGFNRSHAVAYAIDSYMCAWLLTKYPTQWLRSYLEAESTTPLGRAEAFSNVKSIGYRILPIDANFATTEWSVSPDCSGFMPSLTSCKALGTTAALELMSGRPYRMFEDILWNEDGSWRPSKFNKRALEALIKVKAFDSFDCVGEGKLFQSYKHMHFVVIEKNDEIKKSLKKDPFIGKNRFYDLCKNERCAEWTKHELINNQFEVFGAPDLASLVSPTALKRMGELEIASLDERDEDVNQDINWFIIASVEEKSTKASGKKYIRIKATGPLSKTTWVNVWGWTHAPPPPFSVCIAEIEKNDFGYSTRASKLKILP